MGVLKLSSREKQLLPAEVLGPQKCITLRNQCKKLGLMLAAQGLRAVPNSCCGLNQVGAPREAGSKPLGTVILLVLLLNPKHDIVRC